MQRGTAAFEPVADWATATSGVEEAEGKLPPRREALARRLGKRAGGPLSEEVQYAPRPLKPSGVEENRK